MPSSSDRQFLARIPGSGVLLLCIVCGTSFAQVATDGNSKTDQIAGNDELPNAEAERPAIERANSTDLFMAAAEMIQKKKLEDAGFLFYVAQLRARIDLDVYEQVESDDSGNGPGLAIAAIRFRLGEVINPALMRSREKFARVVDRIENWVPAYSSTYSPGWEYKHEVSETEFNQVAQETKSRWLEQMREFEGLLQDEEYFRLFCLVQECNYREAEQLPWALFEDKPGIRRQVTYEEGWAAESRLKEIEQEHKVEYGMFGGGSKPPPPRKPDYVVEGTKVMHEGRPLAGADAATFEILSNPVYAKDAKHAYVYGYRIPGADPKTFRVIGGPYARDKVRIFCGNVPMQVADIEAFEVVSPEAGWQLLYSKEFLSEQEESALATIAASPESPAVMGKGWARDGNHYYYGVSRVESADYPSFKIIDRFYAEDKDQDFDGATPMKKGSIPSWVDRHRN